MYSPFRHINSVFSKSHPIHLTFFITRKCNSACPFCFYLRTNDARQSTESELTVEEIRKISLSFGELLWLAFSGGAILLEQLTRPESASPLAMYYEDKENEHVVLREAEAPVPGNQIEPPAA